MTNWDDVPDEGPESVTWALGFYGGASGMLRQVAFGLGDATRVLLEFSPTEDGGVRMGLTVGDGPDPTTEGGMAQALDEVCDLLESFAGGLRDSRDDLVAGYAAQEDPEDQDAADLAAMTDAPDGVRKAD